MTYKELANKILTLSEEKQNTDVSIVTLDSTEVFKAIDFVEDWKEVETTDQWTDEYFEKGSDIVDGVLDEGHPYLTIAF